MSVNPDKYHYGLDAEIQRKIAAKFSPERAAEAQRWLEALIGYRFPSGFQPSLKSGVILCEAINRIKPGIIKKISKLNSPFKQRENIVAYLQGSKRLGVREHDMFVSQDLYEGDNLVQVVNQIFALGSAARKVPGFRGPFIGVKTSDKNPRHFTPSQIHQSKNVVPKLSQGSYPVQDQSRNPSLDRQIIRNVSGIKASGMPSRLHAFHKQPDKSSGLDKIIRNPSELKNQRGSAAFARKSPPTTAASSGPKFCGNCGAKRQQVSKFCSECGTKF